MRSLPKIGSTSTSRTQGTREATESPKTPETPKQAESTTSQSPALPLSDKAKAKAIGQKQQSGLLKRAVFDQALQAKGTSSSASASSAKLKGAERAEMQYTQKSEQLHTAKGNLDKARKEADAARAELKAFPELPGKLKSLEQRMAKTQKEATELEKSKPDFVKNQRKMWGGSEPEKELKDLKQAHSEIQRKIKQGDGPLKEKVKQAQGEEKKALQDFFGAAKELKGAVKEYAPYKKKENFELSEKLAGQASKLRKESDFLHEKHPAVQVTHRTETKSVRERSYGDMHSTTKTHTKHLPADVRKIHRTPEQEAQKTKDLKEASLLSDQARGKEGSAERLRQEAVEWKKGQLQDIADLVKQYKD